MLGRDRYRLLVVFNLVCCAALFTLGNLLPWRGPVVRWGLVGTAGFFLFPIGWGVFWATDPVLLAGLIIINAFLWARLVNWLFERPWERREGQTPQGSADETEE
jgi:hypothetical protein